MAKAKRPKPKRPMYTAEQRMNYERCPCDPRPPVGLAEEEAEKKLKGGYKTGINNRCERHPYMVLTANGTCIFCE